MHDALDNLKYLQKVGKELEKGEKKSGSDWRWGVYGGIGAAVVTGNVLMSVPGAFLTGVVIDGINKMKKAYRERKVRTEKLFPESEKYRKMCGLPKSLWSCVRGTKAYVEWMKEYENRAKVIEISPDQNTYDMFGVPGKGVKIDPKQYSLLQALAKGYN
jgi:hypothetical protein